MRVHRWWLDYLSLTLTAALVLTLTIVAPGKPTGSREASTITVPIGHTASGWGGAVTPCSDSETQASDSSYSPPCFTFTGDYGGATAPGVTADTITVAYRVTDEPNFFSLLAQLGGVSFDESPEDLLRTTQGLVDYFNQSFQFYGRRIELVPYNGRGHVADELMGGGRDNAAP